MTTATHDAQQTTILDANDGPEESDDTREGLFPDMPDEAYYDLDRPGSTAIKEAAGATPAEYAHWVEEDDGPSDAQSLGRLVHEAILETEKWRNRPPPAPVDADSLRGKAGKAAKLEAQGLGTHAITERLGFKRNKTVKGYRDLDGYSELVSYYREHDPDRAVSGSNRVVVGACRKAVQGLDEARDILDGARTEVAALATVDDVPCRAKFDALTDDEVPTPIDLKTTRRGPRRSASRDDWGYVVGDCGYHVQAGAYLLVLASVLDLDIETAIEAIGWQWIAVETDPPHLAAVHRASTETLEAGVDAARDGLETIRAYRDGDRSGYRVQGATVSVPGYMLD